LLTILLDPVSLLHLDLNLLIEAPDLLIQASKELNNLCLNTDFEFGFIVHTN